jgi:long-chain acyl-CoA synthetase
MGANQSLLPPQQSYEVDAPAKPGEGKARRKFGVTELPTEVREGTAEVSTLWHLFEAAAKKFGDSPCIGKRVKKEGDDSMPFEFINYTTTLKQVLTVGSGFKNLGLKPKEGLGIYAANRMEWMLSQMGGYSQNLITVPLYDTLGESAVKYEITHAELRVIVVEKSKIANVVAVAKECPSLKFVIQLEPLTDAERASMFQGTGIKLMDFGELTKSGVESPQPPTPPHPDDLSFIMYTSGTTGDPKGVCLSHRAVAVSCSSGGGLDLRSSDRYLSWLPLAHIFETMVENALFCVGASVGYFQGNIKLLMDDIQALKPTLFVGVPRIFSRVYDKANAAIEAKGAKVKALFSWAMARELECRKQGTHTVFSFLFKNVRKALGGEVRLIISGAAPLPSHVQEFLTCTMGCPVMQGCELHPRCLKLRCTRRAPIPRPRP